ncbi:MAG TPA: type II toxin-antitoxin system RelE/ParE family toxin [Clostridia bacterium]|nr:type II toxin-antitoxin system RelE/ParE family toxin [Clostridia bacterium]
MNSRNKFYSVVISDRAADMLVQHIRFTAQLSLEAADRLRVEIIEAAKSLEYFPERNPWLSDPILPANKYRKMIINKRFLLIYQLKDDMVFVEYVLDCRQDYKWLI